MGTFSGYILPEVSAVNCRTRPVENVCPCSESSLISPFEVDLKKVLIFLRFKVAEIFSNFFSVFESFLSFAVECLVFQLVHYRRSFSNLVSHNFPQQ